MLDLTRYARRVDSQRLGVALAFGIVAILATGFLVYSLIVHITALFVPPLIMAVGFASYALWIATPLHPHPNHLEPLVRHVSGQWRAGLLLRDFPEAVQEYPSVENSVGTIDGKINFSEDGTIVWTPMRQFGRRRYPGITERRWQPPYQVWARRRRGPLHEVHVVIQTGPDQVHMRDVWLYSAKNFPI